MCDNYPIRSLEADQNFKTKLLNVVITHLSQKNRRNSIEAATLRRAGIITLADLTVQADGQANNVDNLRRICLPELRNVIGALLAAPVKINDHNQRGIIPNCHMYILHQRKWQHIALLTSKNVQTIIYPETLLLNTKLADFSPDVAPAIYRKIKQLNSVQLKTRMLRMIHGDVYCGSRLFKFNLSDSDQCIRCFGKETIKHLIYECPYTLEVWHRLNLNVNDLSIAEILNVGCSETEF